jgi:hypothetical protein
MRQQFLLAGLMIALLSGSVAAQGRKVYPVDEAAKDRSFKTFRDQLMAAARKKDKEFVLSILDPKIELSFGGHSGIKDFKEMWKIDSPNSKFWNELTTILQMGGSFKSVEGTTEFIAPYVTSQWPDDPSLDVFDYVAVIGTNVRLRSTPGTSAKVVESLSYDIVNLVQTQPAGAIEKDGFKWLKVKTGTGTEGYVAAKYVRSPIDYRAYFRKINGSWRMTAFIAGD